MAPVDDPPGALGRYLDNDIKDVVTKYDKLWEVEDEEENPYKSKYEARVLLESAVKDIKRLLGETSEGDEAHRGREMLARLRLFLGKNYYFCEEVPMAEKFFNRSLEQYMRSPLRLEPEHFVHIQDVFNQLGMLWCNRQGHGQGMNYLRRAQIMFEKRPDSVRQACEQKAADNYTLTMFYLAQAYGALRKPGLSARFCAETMSQQLDHNTSGTRPREALERDPFDCKDWVRNCCALSDFFINECMFWTAEYLLQSAAIMCERCDDICGLKPEGLEELTAECKRDLANYYSTRLKFAKTCSENPDIGEDVWRGERKPAAQPGAIGEGSRLSFQCSADAAGGGDDEAPYVESAAPVVWDDIFPEVVHLEDEEAEDNRLAEETGGGDTTTTAADSGKGKKHNIGWLEYGPGERVRLPVYFKRLHEFVERRIRKANAGFLVARGALSPESEQAKKKEGEETEAGTPCDTQPPQQPSCIGTSYEAAREIFKLANHYQKRALEYFLLDGWATEHTRIMQELSQMYRTILFWEADRKRAAAMLSRRLRMLGPLVDVLNPKVYVAFFRQMTFELAEVSQQLYELRAHGKLPDTPGSRLSLDDDDDELDPRDSKLAARCNHLAQTSVAYYGKFVESYHEHGKVPDKIEDDNARVYLTARLNRARLRTKMRGLGRDECVEAHKQGLREYEWILGYGKRHPQVATHPEIGMATELKLCEEMVGMLPARLSRLAAGR